MKRAPRQKTETELSGAIRSALETLGVWVVRVQTFTVTGYGRIRKSRDRGTPDLWTPHGWLEVKRPKAKSNPETEAAQQSWRERAQREGVRVAVVRSVEEAVRVVGEWKSEREHAKAMGWS